MVNGVERHGKQHSFRHAAYLGKQSSFKVRKPVTPLLSFLAKWIKSVTAIKDRLTCDWPLCPSNMLQNWNKAAVHTVVSLH